MKHDLDKALIEYSQSDIYPFHMPGHKRQRLLGVPPEEIDITEIEGFDDLHHAEGILREGQERLARLFGADESFYLVNGSTAGNLAAICGCMEKGGRLLLARNCHISVYHAAELMEAQISFLEPEWIGDSGQGGFESERTKLAPHGGVPAADNGFAIPGSISPTQVEEALRQFPDTQAVVITSPTYDGVVSDIRAIADIVHARDLLLIVDAAHGAHFGFSDGFPQKAIALGADVSVESLHKTLPAYTQSSVLHLMRTASGKDSGLQNIPEGTAGSAPGASYRFDAERVRHYLDIFQSTSPSYVLMAGIDRCVRMIEEDLELYRDPAKRGDSLFGQFEERLARFYRGCEELSVVRVWPAEEDAAGIYARDPSRILISATAAGLSGQQLYDLFLEKHHLQMERATEQSVLALTTIMDTDEGFVRLSRALAEMSQLLTAEICDKVL